MARKALSAGKPEASLSELALVFLRLGTTAFGGPAAHIAMMRQEFVERRAWLTDQEFLDLIAAANLVPGPSSTEVAIHVGRMRAGWRGLALAGVCFILPAALIVGVIAWSYKTYGGLPQAKGFLYGVKPVVIAVIAQAIWMLGRTLLKKPWPAALAALTIALALWGVNPLFLLAGCGAAMLLASAVREKSVRDAQPLLTFLGGIAAVAAAAILGVSLVSIRSPEPLSIFAAFAKIGSVLYGSGYVLLAFLRTDFVLQRGWLTQGQLIDAVAVGQFTPGPVFTTATFIGYQLGGPVGAVVATLGIFAPAFVFVALSGRLISRLRDSKVTSAFLDGVNAASVGLMAAVGCQLAGDAVHDAVTVALALGSLLILLRFKLNSAWLILAGAIVGYIGQR